MESFTYAPTAGFTGVDTFDYVIIDPSGEVDAATVAISVTADSNPTVNDDPDANDDNAFTQLNTPISGNALGNDTDPNGNSLTVTEVHGTTVSGSTSITTPNGGSLVIDETGEYVYTPGDGFSGTETVAYHIADGIGGADVATIAFTVFDPPPVVFDEFNVTTPLVPATGNVLDNATSEPGDDLAISDGSGSPISGPTTMTTDQGGTLVIEPNGKYAYTPPDGFLSEDTIDLEVCDEGGNCVELTLTIAVRDTENNASSDPVAADDYFVVHKDNTVAGSLISNDGDPDGDPITITETPVFGPSNGTLVINSDGTFEYTPDTGFIGTDNFTYEICDDTGACDIATVEVTVLGDNNGDGNDPPVGGEDIVYVQKNESATGNLLDNDTDLNGDALTVTTTPETAPTNGVVTIKSDGSFSYIPNFGFSGNDSFQYEVCDESGACDVVSVHVVIFNEPPLAIDDQFEMLGNTLSGSVVPNDNDPDGDPMSALIVNRPQHGSIVWNTNGTFQYTRNGSFTTSDQFTYKICDDSGVCRTATVTISAPFAFDSFTNQQTDQKAFDELAFRAQRPREILLSQKLGALAQEPIVAGYAIPGTTLIGRIYDEYGALVGESTAQVNSAGNWVMQFFNSKCESHFTVMIEHVATDQNQLGNIHFRLTPDTYRALQLGAIHTKAVTAGTILSDSPSTSLEIWHRQNVHPLRLL